MGDPCVRLDLFPLDGPASLLRWGPLDAGNGRAEQAASRKVPHG